MKLQIAMAAVSIGAAAVVGLAGGSSTPNDFTKVVNRSPAAVYTAFSAMEPEGERPLAIAGVSAGVTQRVTKVPNEQVRLEILVNGDVLVSADLQFAPAPHGQGTTVSGEIDANQRPLTALMRASGQPVPSGVLDHAKIDRLFAAAMTQMVGQVEAGEPLMSVSAAASLMAAEASGRDAPLSQAPVISERPSLPSATRSTGSSEGGWGPDRSGGEGGGWGRQ